MIVLRHRSLARACAVVTLLLFFVSCSNWKNVPVKEVESDQEMLLERRVKFFGERTWELYVVEVQFPMVRGPQYDNQDGAVFEVDLRNISGIEVYGIDGSRTFFAVLGVVALAVIVIAIASSGDDDPPPQTTSTNGSSCPVLYVRGPDATARVGEAYAGAAFRSVQRDDLLPVPAVHEPVTRCVFANEARETQYTDVLELVLVEHPQGTRAVAGVDQAPLLVGEARAPVAAADANGADVAAALARTDGALWQTPWDRLMESDAAPLTESVTARFERPRAGGDPVLELVLNNSYWLEFTIGHFFAMAGAAFDQHMAMWNRPDNGPFVRGWLEREGVSLAVEQRRDGRWERVATVPPAGPLALRRVAVPLPAVPADGTIDVRVTGGTGFWQIDEMSLSTRSPAEPRVTRIAPSRAVDGAGTDRLALVTAADGEYQVLERSGERLEFDFAVPPAGAGMARSAFLFSNGYYNVHPPAAGATAPSTVTSVSSREGGLADLGIDIYRRYHKIALETPRRTETVTEVKR